MDEALAASAVPPATAAISSPYAPKVDAGTAPWWGNVGMRFVVGLALMAIVGWLAWEITQAWATATPAPRIPVDGLGIFAVFFVAALAVERLLEPISLLDWRKPKLERQAQTALTAVSSGSGSPQAASDAVAKKDAWSAYRALALWAIASIVGALAAALLNLHLLKTAGIETPSLFLEILATGLIIGAGTKPLHELNKLVTAKKEVAEGR